MKRIAFIGLIFLLLFLTLPTFAQDSTPEATDTPVEDYYPALDTTYCIDGLHFNYPSTWEKPYSITPPESDHPIIDIVLTNYHGGRIDDKFYSIGIEVHEEKELLALFPDSDDHARPLMDELYRRYSDLFANQTLEDFVVHTYGEKLLILNVWNTTGEEFNTLYNSGYMVTASTLETGNYYDWRDTLVAIIDTITYDPSTPCPAGQ